MAEKNARRQRSSTYDTLKVPSIPARTQQHVPAMDQQLKLAGMMQNGGLIVIGETVATVHKEMAQQHSWETIGYGIPCLTTKEDGLLVSISSIDSGETLHQFHLDSPEKYQVMDNHFHTLHVSAASESCAGKQGERTGACYGISFAHVKVAERFSQAIQQLIPRETLYPSQYVSESGQLMRAMSEMSLVCHEYETIDLPHGKPFRGRLHSMEEAGALTSSGNFPTSQTEAKSEEDDEQAWKVLMDLQTFNVTSSREELIEDVDGRPNSKHYKKLSLKRASHDKEKKRKYSSEGSPKRKGDYVDYDDINISFPTSVRHVGHVDTETPLHSLTRVVTGGSAPETVLSSQIGRRSRRSPSVPIRRRSRWYRRYTREANSAPTILVTPANSKRQSSTHLKNVPSPPPPVDDFEALIGSLQSLQTSTGKGEKEGEEGIELNTCSDEDTWQTSFHSAVAGLIRKKLHDEALYSKLLSFTQSGRPETSEKPAHRAASVIIHDHGVVCL